MNLQLLFNRTCIPDPQMSRGDPLDSIKIQLLTFKCWQVLPNSPVFQAYLEIESHLAECLRHPDLDGGCSVLYTPCLIGQQEDRIRPALVVHCPDKRYRDFAVNLIRRSEEWRSFVRNHTTFVLVKLIHAPVLLAKNDFDGRNYVFGLQESIVNLGQSLRFIIAQSSEAGAQRQAVQGIVLRVLNEPYLLTVSHPVKEVVTSQRATEDVLESTDENEIFFFDDEDDSLSNDSSHDAWSSIGGSPARESLTSTQVISSSQATSTLPPVRQAGPSLSVETLKSNCIGEIRYQSSSDPGQQSDWLLCKIDKTVYERSISVKGVNRIRIDGRVILVRSVAAMPLVNTTVLVVTNSVRPLQAKLLATPSRFRMPGSDTFLQVLTIRLQEALTPGDCGAAIIDPVDGRWYGHLVAGEKNGHTGYLILGSDIIADISSVMKIPVDVIKFDTGAGSEVLEKSERERHSSRFSRLHTSILARTIRSSGSRRLQKSKDSMDPVSSIGETSLSTRISPTRRSSIRSIDSKLASWIPLRVQNLEPVSSQRKRSLLAVPDLNYDSWLSTDPAAPGLASSLSDITPFKPSSLDSGGQQGKDDLFNINSPQPTFADAIYKKPKTMLRLWTCSECGHGPHKWEINIHCSNCQHKRCGKCKTKKTAAAPSSPYHDASIERLDTVRSSLDLPEQRRPDYLRRTRSEHQLTKNSVTDAPESIQSEDLKRPFKLLFDDYSSNVLSMATILRSETITLLQGSDHLTKGTQLGRERLQNLKHSVTMYKSKIREQAANTQDGYNNLFELLKRKRFNAPQMRVDVNAYLSYEKLKSIMHEYESALQKHTDEVLMHMHDIDLVLQELTSMYGGDTKGLTVGAGSIEENEAAKQGLESTSRKIRPNTQQSYPGSRNHS